MRLTSKVLSFCVAITHHQVCFLLESAVISRFGDHHDRSILHEQSYALGRNGVVPIVRVVVPFDVIAGRWWWNHDRSVRGGIWLRSSRSQLRVHNRFDVRAHDDREVGEYDTVAYNVRRGGRDAQCRECKRGECRCNVPDGF